MAAKPSPEETESALRSLRAAAREVSVLLEGEGHSLIRQELERVADSLEIQIRACELGDANLLEEAGRIRERAPRGLRNLSKIPDGTAWLLDENNLERWRAQGEAGQVWIRWDHLPLDKRADAVSLASYLRDLTGKRKRAGRPPRGSRR